MTLKPNEAAEVTELFWSIEGEPCCIEAYEQVDPSGGCAYMLLLLDMLRKGRQRWGERVRVTIEEADATQA